MNRFKIGTVKIFIILQLATFMIVAGVVIPYITYSNQNRDDLIKAISESDKRDEKARQLSDARDENQTQTLLNFTLSKADRNYLALVNSTNQTNTLLKFLTDNFGENSGYLENEILHNKINNDTNIFVKYGILNQIDIIHNQCLGLKLRNQTCFQHFNETLNRQILQNLTEPK